MSETTNDGHNVNVASTGLSLSATETKEFFLPPWGLGYATPEFQRGRAVGRGVLPFDRFARAREHRAIRLRTT